MELPPFERKAVRSGWITADRWVIPNFYRIADNIEGSDAYGNVLSLKTVLGNRVSEEEINPFDFEHHLDVQAFSVIREHRRVYVGMALEHLERLRCMNLRLGDLSSDLEVCYARNQDEYRYCEWLSSEVFKDVREIFDKASPDAIPRVDACFIS